MKFRRHSVSCSLFTLALAVAIFGQAAVAQDTKAKPALAAKTTGTKPVGKSGSKPAAKPAAAPTAADKHIAANMKFLGVLSRYAQTLATAKDAATAQAAATKLETITRDAITIGEELVKLGKPTPEIEMRLATDADLKLTAQSVAEQTRTAVKTLAANGQVKTILAPAVENFQAALNRVQQAADEPQGLNNPAPPAETPAPADVPKPAAGPQPASDATDVPPPPPQ